MSLNLVDLELIAEEIPSFHIPKSALEGGVNIIDLLSDFSSVLPSKSEARRAIQGNAITVNKEKVSDIQALITSGALLHDRFMMVENGKKNKSMLIFT